MGITITRWLLLFLCIAQISALSAKPVSIYVQDRRDYEILNLFFENGILEEEYGYVLKGVKPISARQFYALDAFPMKNLQLAEKEFKKTLLVREAIPIWDRLCSKQDQFALKAIPVIENDAGSCGFEVQFIHVPKLREVIGENINLFRYVLGPAIEIEELVKRLAYSNERLTDVLQDDLTLTGIVLGFGSHNSIVGGRLETIDRLSISIDSAPFLPNSTLLGEENSWWMFGTNYLAYAGGENSSFKRTIGPLRPSHGFRTLKDEISSLASREDSLPEPLHHEPRFIFSAFKGGDSNRPLFKTLQKVQLLSKKLLQVDNHLDKVLEIIGGKKPRITCDRSPTKKSVWSLVGDIETLWSCILKGAIHGFKNEEDKKAFKQALATPPESPTPPPMIGASRELLCGFQQARDNLVAAKKACLALSKDPSVQTVIPNQLYIKTVQEGTGESLEGINRLRLKYVIEDSLGNVLFANNDIWINLSETIPGFAHGLQGMRIGEKRTLFIHPALGYGALTTLPPCILLIARVQLLDADLPTKTSLSPATPLEFNWLLDERPLQAIQDSIALLPIYKGAFYRSLLDQIEWDHPFLDQFMNRQEE